MITVVNMIPFSLSGESNQDSEPNLAVNPAKPTDMVGTAFTPSPMGGAFSPVYISTNGGNTWSLRNVVPGAGFAGTGDITVAFATTGGTIYAGTLNGSTGRLNILRWSGIAAVGPMSLLVDRANEDQPWVIAGSVVVSGSSRDRVYVGNNDFNQPSGHTATVDLSLNAKTAAAPAGFAPHSVERRPTIGQDGPPVRNAMHSDGTIYSAHHRWASGSVPNITMDIVVCRDDKWGSGANPFSALVDPGDGKIGKRVATGRFIKWNGAMGQERLGGDLAIACDPTNSSVVYVAWCDRVGGLAGTDWTVHVRRSTNRGVTWSKDIRTVTNAKNPGLAVDSGGRLGFVCQQFRSNRWVTQLELTSNAWSTASTNTVLHTAPSTTPPRTFWPYIGDYLRILAVGKSFHGVFSGNNTPDNANFPNGVTYQRAANFTTHTLFHTDGVTPVAPSIDPFYFHWTDNPIIRERGIIPTTPIRSIDPRTVIPPAPIPPQPISREPIITPIGPRPGPGQGASNLDL